MFVCSSAIKQYLTVAITIAAALPPLTPGKHGLADVTGENFDAAINAELRKISTFYIDKEEELDVSDAASAETSDAAEYKHL